MRIFAGFVALLLVGGCGFQPLYSKGGGAKDKAVNVLVAPIADRKGQILRNRLQDIFAISDKKGRAPYVLKVELSENLREIGIINAYETRSTILMRAHWQLLDRRQQGEIAAGELSEAGSYDIVTNDYANVVSRRGTREKILQRMARVIAANVRVSVKRQRLLNRDKKRPRRTKKRRAAGKR